MSPNLDLLRALAVAFVVGSHLKQHVWLPLFGPTPAYDIDALGHIGVAMFFVHTCLVLMLSLERQGAQVIPFLIRRAFRIYPLAIVSVLLATALWGLSNPVDWGAVASNLLLTQNLTQHASRPAVLWSLPYELQMYLLLPAVFMVARRWAAWMWVGSILMVGMLALAGLDFRLVQYWPCFRPGVLAYTLSHRIAPRLSAGWLFFVVLLAAVCCPMLQAAGAPEIVLLWCVCIGLGVAIPLCRPISNKALTSAAAVVATYSYGVYLTHSYAIGIALGGLQFLPVPMRLCVFALLLTALPWLAYHAVEKRGIALGKRLSERMNVGRLALG